MTSGIRQDDSINDAQSSCGFFGVYPDSGCSIDDGLTFGRIARKRRRLGKAAFFLMRGLPHPLAAK